MKIIPLSRGKTATVDDDMLETIGVYSWCFDGAYAKGYVNRKAVLLHRFVLDAQPGEQVDHINSNKLDNRRENLRICTQAQNQMNRKAIVGITGYKGVHFHKPTKRYYAQIGIDGKNIHLGCFQNAEEAAIAYDNAAIIHFGKFAKTNRSIYE